MRHLRSLGYSSLLALTIASPACAQMTPESVWTILQDYFKTSGAELAVGETKRDGDRLVLSNVTLNTTQEEVGTTTVAIPEVVLRDIGEGRVEITTSTESIVKSTLTGVEGETIETEMKVLTEGSRTITSGSPEKPVFDIAADRWQLIQLTELGDGSAPVNATITGEQMTGLMKLDRVSVPNTIDYTMAMDKFLVVTEGSAEGEEGAEDSAFAVNLQLDALKASYVGTLPEGTLSPEEAIAQLDGKFGYSTGPMVVQVKATGPMPMAAAFLTKSSALDLQFATAGGKFSYDLKGIAITGDTPPGENTSASDLSAKGSVAVPATGPDGAPNIEAAYGKVSLELSGLTPLLDSVVAAKLATAEDVAGIKMMMGFFTRPGSTPDSIAVELEQTVDGKALINGEEMP